MKTSEDTFHRKEVFPGDEVLKTAFGAVYPFYTEILALIGSYSCEWKFYGPKIGWQFKATKKGKALFYLTPQDGGFRLGFAVRDIEKEMLLNSKLPEKKKTELAGAKRYSEGYPLRLEVKEKADMKAVRLVVDTLKSLRS